MTIERRFVQRATRVFAGALATLAMASASATGSKEAAGTGIGDVDFQAACAAEVGEDFDRAVAMLHHMMYAQAREAFERIAAKDSDCAMAHWGIAQTLYQPLWPTRPGAEELERGRETLQRARDIGVETDREEALLAAAEAFFEDPDADWWTRIDRWADALGSAHENHPDDREIGVFYALSRIAVGQTADDRAAHNTEGAQAALAVHEESPTHPGAIHYLIHANDIDARAGENLDVVRAYSDIAPSVPHALHMPTHIFVRLGHWPEVIEWNQRSADAALEHPAGDHVSHHYPHAADYLVYAHLQRGEDGKARGVLDEVLARQGYQPSFISAFHLAAMPARFAVERRDWERAAAIEPRTPTEIPWDNFAWPEALSWTARGLGAAHQGHLEQAREAEARLAALRDSSESAGESGFANYIEIDRLLLAGHIAREDGRSDEALALLKQAANLEDTMEKHPVTPGALLPPREALGELLLELDRPAEALEAFRSSQAVWPGRYRTLLGAARAASAAGDEDAAREYYGMLLETTAAESDGPDIEEARKALGKT